MSLLEIFEPEEYVGRFWHRLVGQAQTYPRHPDGAVKLADIRPVLGVVFRGLGGDRAVELAAAGQEESGHRLTLRQRLGMAAESLPAASLGEAALRLPERLDIFPSAEDNRRLYIWLTAFFAAAPAVPAVQDTDPLRRDLRALRIARAATHAALEQFPGLRRRHAALAEALLSIRPKRPAGSPEEAHVEAIVRALLGDDAPPAKAWEMFDAVIGEDAEAVMAFSAPLRYAPFLPVPLWGEVRPLSTVARPDDDEEDNDHAAKEPQDERKKKASRKSLDQPDRDDPLILNRFEKILALAEMVNVNRGKDDDDEENAKKAAEDLDEIVISPNKKKTAARLRLDLDLPPDAATGEAITGKFTYPEWDYRKGVMLPNHCRVLTGPAATEGEDWEPDDTARRLIHRVRRQFEALRPRMVTFRRQADGDDLDLEALVRSRVDMVADGTLDDRVYQKTRAVARDLSVAVLVDVSLSTDAWMDDRRVLDVEKEALSVFLSGINACGDENAVFTFTSRKRDNVRVSTVKDFDEPFGDTVLRRVAALKPGSYTRMGAAVRHVAAQLEKRPHRHRLLLVLTDGKPNDMDHYEGRFGIEDTRRALADARRKGLTVFGVTVDQKAQDYFPALFGRGRYAIVGQVGRLSRALPRIYHNLSQQ
ncbi:Nitric oxide reductase activation protein NorD [Caenispirillum salinarum AK4]|uniref:Nitric oxide reductase activation protein NorD n=1 Tax=Caenispirillum salinarum AK4 TaxID=1238182 RepID=K9HAK7_9PROT|nr:VWA domain-containing protein [Caenispirillum salinarum]EKV27603.1 Nitric oxide reductase activation protein NorD [Caenispirillum salinarum AK4]